MRKLSIIILLILSICSISVFAEKGYLEAKDYSTLSIQEFLNQCKLQNKNAFFNKNVYTLSTDLNVVDGVDIIGEEGTIFQSNGVQKYIFDTQNVSDLTIENIIFDNVTIWCQRENSTGWIIRKNIFLNARDLDTAMGCKPDSNGKNGGTSTGYYIQNKRGSMQIISNMFLRDSSSLGRGVATYYTKDVIIKDNFFGRLEDVEKSIVSTETKHLKDIALASGRVDSNKDYGYFMTGINILNSDVNAKIIGNYMSFNTHITEAGYEDGSQSTNGYNRDHFIYAKAFQNLEIVGNYFKGMNKNQDGGVKCRNGEGLLIYKNVLEDSLILLYVQNDATGAVLKNVDIRENIFINKDYTTKIIKIPYGDNKELSKYLTVDYSILFLNYREDSEVDSITISSNLFYSNGLGNEQIRIDNRDKTYNVPTNIYIENNKNCLGNLARITTRNFKDQDNIDVRTDWNNGIEYQATLLEEYRNINVRNLASIQEVPYEISDGKLITSAAKAFVDGKLYENQTLSIGKKYFLFLLNETTSSILVEETVEDGIPSFEYTALEIELQEPGFEVVYEMNGHGTQEVSLKEIHFLPNPLPAPTDTGWSFEGWYYDSSFTKKAEAGQEIKENTKLYAKWIIKTYSIEFDTNGGNPISLQEVSHGSLLTPPPTPVKDNYIFEGWYLDKDLIYLFDFNTGIDSDLTLYAKWKKIKYFIDFDIQGHGIQPQSIEVEGEIPLVLPDLIEAGWNFGGWFTDVACQNEVILGSNITENITLYAKWTEIIYIVNFADVNLNPISVKSNGTIAKPTDPTKEGYIFEGWYKEKECLNAWNFITDKVTKDITLYPKWNKVEDPIPIPSTYTVSFESNGGSLISSISIQKGGKITKPTSPVKEGYTFEGWYKNSKLTELWNFETDLVEENVILYAKWNKNEVIENESSSSNLATILSISISIGVGVLGLCFLAVLIIRKKRSE